MYYTITTTTTTTNAIATIILICYYYYCSYSYYLAIIRSHFGTRAQVASWALLQEHGVPSAAAKAGG